ncbi:MAG: hypothetical protein ABSH09_01875 [Bryobacteraceae bacterium]|jgi:hypothetical protein
MKAAYGIQAIGIFLQYVLPAAISLAALPLFLRTLGRIQRLEAQIVRNSEEVKAEAASLSKALATLKSEVDATAEAAPAVPLSAGSNATMRAKVLKMHRLGQSVDQISSTLRLSRGEVLLLLKVHKIVLRTFEADQKDAEMPVFDIKTLNGLAG